ncbi:putative aminohydrolase SsnA [Candidatus Bipolaricaulota bacterium]|nr:putative aminohydrolase SsnA [Candidatus Bipolaricaulota bacterium]
MMKRLVERVNIWAGGDAVVNNGAILLDGGTIEAVLTHEELAECEIPAAVERIDGGGRLAIPGLVNAHTHLYSSLARGMSLPGFAPTSFTQILEQLWWRLDKALDAESVRTSAVVGAMEAARCGVTSLIDHHASPYAVPGSLEGLRKAVCDDVGLRGVFCYEVSDRDGEEIALAGIEENRSFLSDQSLTARSSTDHPADDRLSAGLFGLHASFTLSDATLERVASSLPEGVGIHIHVAEGPEDEMQCVAEHGLRIVERLDRFGMLRPTSILAHCLHLDEAEKDLLSARNVIVAHNPRSNMNNAVGAFDLDGSLGRNLLVGLGTDGLGANMLAELFTAALFQKASRNDPLAAPFPSLHRLLFENNPRIVERTLGVKVGRISPGYPADIAILDYIPPTPLSGDTILGHILFGIAVHSLRVTDLFVAGRAVLRDGRFCDFDEDEVYAHAREQAARLWRGAV